MSSTTEPSEVVTVTLLLQGGHREGVRVTPDEFTRLRVAITRGEVSPGMRVFRSYHSDYRLYLAPNSIVGVVGP